MTTPADARGAVAPELPDTGLAEPTSTLLVIAKRPVPGRVKTRLQTVFTPVEAARLAEAALTDTLAALASAPAHRRVVALDGGDGAAERPAWLPTGFDVVDQGGGSLDQRLAASFEAVLGGGAAGAAGRRAAPSGRPEPALLVGMDTPQLTPALLHVDWTGLDAVLGLATDGGFWAVGLRRSLPEAFLGVPMSTAHTGAAQLERLRSLGLRVGLLPWLRDVDQPEDAAAAAVMVPGSAFARVHRELVAAHAAGLPPEVLFEAALAGEPVDAVDGRHRRRLPVEAWAGEASPLDLGVLDRCRAPVLDVGCGPGRMVAALTERGQDALGIDVARAAVASTSRRGGAALRRSVHDRLPGEGQWGTVLLVDGNIGIGGDPLVLLTRCVELLAPGGRVVVEAEPGPGDDDLDVRDAVVLEAADGRRSRPLPWARTGAAALVRLAERCGLRQVERWDAGQRVVLVLERDGAPGG